MLRLLGDFDFRVLGVFFEEDERFFFFGFVAAHVAVCDV